MARSEIRVNRDNVFEVRTRKPRIGRNPNEPNTNVTIPSRSVVRFKPGKEMRESVMKLGTPSSSGEDGQGQKQAPAA